MQIIRAFERDETTFPGLGVRVLLLTGEGPDGLIARRLAGLGGRVDVVDEMFAGLSELIDDPAGYALLVVDCDTHGVGGLELAQRRLQMLGELPTRVPVILVSRECGEQLFPSDRLQPIILRSPPSAVSMKVGFEHALRDRLIYQAA